MSYIGRQPTAAALTASDVTDGIITTAKIADAGITNAKLNADIISGDTALGAEPADTDEFLVSDAGTLKRMDYSYIKGGGITMADQWRLTTSLGGTDAIITSNLEQVDTTGQGTIGSAMTVSSGVFTFPSTGFYLILFKAATYNTEGDETQFQVMCEVTTDNSSFTEIGEVRTSARPEHNNQSAMGSTIVDVTDTSNVKVRFSTSSHQADTYLDGDTTKDLTSFTFIRLGDT